MSTSVLNLLVDFADKRNKYKNDFYLSINSFLH